MNAELWLSGRRGQMLAIGIGLLAMVVLWFGLVDPARSWFSDRQASLDQRQALLHHMRDLAATLPMLRATSSANPGRGTQNVTIMLTGASDAVAAAELQERVQRMASTAGISLTAVETLPATPAGDWHKVSLRISLIASWPVLMDLVRSVEQSSTRIFIDDIHLHSPTIVAHPTVLPIQASMVLYGFRPADTGAGK